jgi:hypothetical protein
LAEQQKIKFEKNVGEALKTVGIDSEVEDSVEIVDLIDGLRLFNGLPSDMI